MDENSLQSFEKEIRADNLARVRVTPEGAPYNEGEDDLSELSQFAASLWGEQKDGEDNRWWFVPTYFGAIPTSEAGFVTDGTQYFDIDRERVGVVELHLNSNGRVFGVQSFYRSTVDGRLKAKPITVFWD